MSKLTEKLTELEKNYIDNHLNDTVESDFYYDNPGAANEDVDFLLNLIKKFPDIKLSDWEKEYTSIHLVGKTKSEFYYDNPGAAIDDINFLLELVNKISK